MELTDFDALYFHSLLLEDFLSQTEGAAGVQQRMQPLVRLFESR